MVAGGNVIRRVCANSEFARSIGRFRGPFRDAGNRGSTLIEAAIVLPVILLVVLGTVEIGLTSKDFLTLGAVSRDDARVAALSARDTRGEKSAHIG